jgi:YHS domain-containing protein
MDQDTPEHHQPPDQAEMVCRRLITGDLTYIPKAEYRGRTLYFCTEYCLRAFEEDPDRFYPAHSRKRVDPQTCEFNPGEKLQDG